MCSYRLALPIVGLALLAPVAASAQDWKTITTMRQFGGEERLEVKVEYGAGELRVEPANASTLYRAQLRYNAEAFRPVNEYRDGRLRLGFHNGKVKKVRHQKGARLDLALGTGVPLDLDLAFGAVAADLELGGLRLRRLKIATGASETKVRFSSPNPERCSLVKFEAGAAAFSVYNLGNANAERVMFDGGVGDITLDFTGEWSGNTHAEIDMGVGSLTLRLPRGLGVRIQKDTFLTSFDSQELTKRGNSFYSENWDRADRRLTVSIDAALGSISIQWVDGGLSAL